MASYTLLMGERSPHRNKQGNTMERTILSIAAVVVLLAISFSPEPAAAQFSAAQRAACGSDAQRLCASSMADPSRLTACMRSNASKVSAGCRAAMGGGKKSKKG
jgi:hypothetical protein